MGRRGARGRRGNKTCYDCRRAAPPLATGDQRLAKKESSNMAAPKIDESRWPLVVVDWVGEVTFEEIDHHFDGMRALVERREPFVVVVDMKAVEGQTARHRQHGGQRLRELGDLASGVVIAAAHVVRSRLVRGALTAVYWIASPPFPTKVFTDRTDAEAWVLAQYGQTHGAPSPVS